MFKTTIKKAAVMAALLVSFSAAAVAADDETRFIADLGYDLGGDTMVSGNYTNGSSWKIVANRGIYISGGVAVPNNVDVGGTLETLATVGYKFDTVTGANGDITFSTIPLTVIEQYTDSSGFNVGVGLTYQMSPEVKGSGVLSGINGKFDSTLGYMLQLGYQLNEISFGARYTIIDYTMTGATGSYKGNGIGFYILGKF